MATPNGGRHIIQYHGGGGWWTGHKGIDLKDPAKYIDAVMGRSGTRARVIDKETGEIYGDGTACSFCGDPHDGIDGSCLL